VLAVVTAPRGRVGKNHRFVVMVRNAGPDACRARVSLRDQATGETIGQRIVGLRAGPGSGLRPAITTFSYRWQPADVGLCRIETSVTPLGVCDRRPENNSAAVTVRVRP